MGALPGNMGVSNVTLSYIYRKEGEWKLLFCFIRMSIDYQVDSRWQVFDSNLSCHLTDLSLQDYQHRAIGIASFMMGR